MGIVLRWKPNKWEKAPLLCRIFGHHWKSGWYGDWPYLNQKYKSTDGLGTFHIALTCECDRCGQTSQVGYIHHKTRENILGRK